ncbi:xylulokinase [Urechidicola vernalis]|uniref:FGGY family carbohydrate kinase n=1 Tax=Urechidicola vernalis TaxID=3075600 RepID=A0ABU2Y772_9FLAO|nr:FGGY family carbohydrate kinase [Urechidicola sp. P050]MDT0553075.1 FGGY family carbohydrate kinase [Urechidicola sp. P050]
MYYIGYDLGSSSIKFALVNVSTGKNSLTLNEPQSEMEISAPMKNWAEQDPDLWWQFICKGTKRIIEESGINPTEILGIGIAYQMHGLVVVDEKGESLRNAIIWCDSRAVEIGNKAFLDLGEEKCKAHILSSPGNFTASKLKWVKDHEPDIYSKIHKFMLPGDFIAHKLTSDFTTTKNGLSEGILWDFKNDKIADWLLDYYGIEESLVPTVVDNFSNQGTVSEKASRLTGLPVGIPINYRAGDQPNNALSLNVFNNGEIAATGGTSGVLYAVTKNLNSNESVRINNFAHANYSTDNKTVGKLLNINGAGIQYRWIKNICGDLSYEKMNVKASEISVGSGGVVVIPFGNGAERMFENKVVGNHILNLNFNQHHQGHLFRAALEGIAFAFVYGMEILKNDNAKIKVIRAGNDNLFRSEIFSNSVATLIGHEIEIYDTTGAVGAARAAGLTDGDFENFGNQIMRNDYLKTYKPIADAAEYEKAYQLWKKSLVSIIKNN